MMLQVRHITCIIIIIVGSSLSIAAGGSSTGSSILPQQHRELITRNEDIAKRIHISILRGNRYFDIEAEDEDHSSSGVPWIEDGSSLTTENSTHLTMLHLSQMKSAITSSTQFEFSEERMANDGQFNPDFVNDMQILSSDNSEDKMTVLSVDTHTGEIQGIQHSSYETKQISISGTLETRSVVRRPPLTLRKVANAQRNFTCGADHPDDGLAGHQHNHADHEHTTHNRGLRGMQHSHSHSLHGTQLLHTTTDSYTSRQLEEQQQHTFTINTLIAIDAPFINRHGSRQNAIKYINYLIGIANTIFTREFNAHINVVKVQEVNIFKNAIDLRDGLSIMRRHYEGTVGTRSGDDGEQINLVHALLGQDLYGGIAFIDTICDSTWGVGLSSGLKGTMTNLNDDAYRDAHMVSHEIGHSLGSGHTFEVGAYNPPVDTCGITCPSSLPKESSATLMSYCQFCNGGLDNIAMTFGGIWDGVGPQSDINSWITSPELENGVSKNPQRVSHHIWNTLAAKGACLIPTPAPSSSPTTTAPSSEPTASPTTKAPTYFPDIPEEDGLIWTQPDMHCKEENCATSPGYMFDLELSGYFESSQYGILIESLQFEHMNRNATVDLYTIEGSYHVSSANQTNVTEDRSYRSGEEWSKVATVIVNASHSFSQVVLDTPIMITPGSKQGFYFATRGSNNFFVVGHGENVSSTDGNGVSFKEASVVFDNFGVDVNGFYPSIQVGYLIVDPPTMSPITDVPSMSPSLEPSVRPTTASPTPEDRGPFAIGQNEECSGDECDAVAGYMLDITNEAKKKMKVISVSFQHTVPKNHRSAELFCSIGSHLGKEKEPSSWTKCGNTKIPRRNKVYTEFVLESPIKLDYGETVGFYVKTVERILVVKRNKEKNEKHDGKAGLFYGSAVKNEVMGTLEEGVIPNGDVRYVMMKK